MKGTDKNILQGFKPLWLIGSAAVLALAAAVVYFMPIIFVFIMLSCGIAAIAAAAVMRFFGGSCGDEDEKEMAVCIFYVAPCPVPGLGGLWHGRGG